MLFTEAAQTEAEATLERARQLVRDAHTIKHGSNDDTATLPVNTSSSNLGDFSGGYGISVHQGM